jgi:nitroreductase
MPRYPELMSLICSRRSVRGFTREAIDQNAITQLMEAARWAPSNHNRQPWKFILIDDRSEIVALANSVREELAQKCRAIPTLAAGYVDDLLQHATVFEGAAAVLVALHRRPVSVGAALLEGLANPVLVSGEPLSVAMSVQNLLLAAEALGLGACVLTAPLLAPNALATAISVPLGCDITCLVALGHSAERPVSPRRKELTHIIEFKNHLTKPNHE